MGLTQKILAFTSLLVVALVGTTLAFTTFQADQLAHKTITDGLAETRNVWGTFQADRYNKLKLGVRVLANDSSFKALVQLRDPASVLDSLRERGQDLMADFFVATDPQGMVIARSDRPGAQGEDLSKDPVVMKPLEGEESATVWRQGDKLYHAVSVPMTFGNDLVGVLIAGYAINEGLAKEIHTLTHSEVAYVIRSPGHAPELSVSSLDAEHAEALRSALSRPDFLSARTEPFELDLGSDRHVAVEVPLKAATGEVAGGVMAIRSLSEETRSFRSFRNGLILVSLLVMVVALAGAFVAARHVTEPVRKLVGLVERARDGSYSGAVSIATKDEIGTLAGAFNSLLADLREKGQMIDYLREGMTLLKKKAAEATLAGAEATAVIPVVGGPTFEGGSLFASRYQIESMLGKGGMGVVYRAIDRKLDEEVALKVLRPEVVRADPTLLNRFKEEIRLARKITHRNVLRTHEFNDADGIAYISMEYLEGVTLKELISNKGALPLGVGLRIAKQMCLGLEAAHREGIIHRDIKPQNMLILPETGELKIMDFGIARKSEVKGKESGLTSVGTVMGTPDYIPPEQAQGHPADFRSDIYSLGVVFFECFTGTLPFDGDTIMEIVMKQIQEPAPSPRSVNPKIPEDLEVVLLKCLEKDPAKRYQAVADLLKDLNAISATLDAA